MIDKFNFRQICESGLAARGFANDERYKLRLAKEIKEVEAQGEQEYLLGVREKFLKEKLIYPKNEHNLLVAYVLGLTNEFDIEKEFAFVVGEFPDIDIDYLKDVRDYLKRTWAAEKFGQEYICEIGTYGTSGIKSAILDMARVHSEPRDEIQSITTKMADKDDEGHELEWDKALEIYPDFKSFCERYPHVAHDAKMALDRNKSGGVHAGGLIIADRQIDGFVPLEVRSVTKENPNGVICSAWTEGLNRQDLGPVGLIKFDLLVINNLMQIALACKLIKERYGIEKICALPGSWDWSDVSYLNDPKALEMANKADLKAIFQFDSEGIRKLVKKGGVNSFDDLPTYSALYRPGPLNKGMDVSYCRRKKGEEPFAIHPKLQGSLGSTYGILCIHEDTFVSMADGREQMIKNIVAGDKVHSVNLKTKKVEIKECHGCAPSKIDNGYLMTLSNGFSVILTGDHEVLTWDGMKRVDQLSNTDLVACPETIKPDNPISDPLAEWLGKDEDVAYLLGQLIGNGCMTSTGVALCTGTEIATDKIKQWIEEKLPTMKINKYFHCRSWYLGLSNPNLIFPRFFNGKRSKFLLFLENLLMRKKAHFKRIPDKIMTASESVRLSFLAGLIDSDVCTKEGMKENGVCHINSVSKGMLNDIRKMMAMLGVVCYTDSSCRIHVFNQVKLGSLLRDKLVVKKFEGKLLDGKTVGMVPRKEIRNFWEKSGLTQREFTKKHGLSRSSLRLNKPFSTTETFQMFGGQLGDLRYYSVNSIEIITNQQFYKMSVSDNHNLIANGIVVKNCYQEQIMDMLRIVGGIPDMHTEKIRKAISKKDAEKFIKYKEMFIQNGEVNLNVNPEYLIEMWSLIESFAEYGFNKSHSYSYGYISARLLWLKAHYPLEFYTSILQCESDHEKMKDYKLDAKYHGIDVKPVHINKSKINFSIHDESGKSEIFFGFSNVKTIGEQAASRIVENQPYNSFVDYLDRFGTDAAPLKALTALGVFEEKYDRIHLRKYAEFYKTEIGKRKDRQKRFELSMDKKIAELKKLLLEEVKEDDPDFEKMCDYSPEAEAIWEQRFSALIRQTTYKYKGETRIREVSFFKLLQDLAKSRATSIKNFYDKEKESEDGPSVSLEKFNPSLIQLKPEEEALFTSELITDGVKSFPEAESTYYGFQWTHLLEASPDYTGATIDKFLEEAEANPKLEASMIEVQVKQVQKRTSKGEKATVFYSISVEDANCKQMKITMWQDDYERFKEEIKVGELLKMQVRPPSGGFFTLMFKSVEKHKRKYLPPKENDVRLVKMRKPVPKQKPDNEDLFDKLKYDEAAIILEPRTEPTDLPEVCAGWELLYENENSKND